MISFFTKDNSHVYAVESEGALSPEIHKKLKWLFSGSDYISNKIIESKYVGPRSNMTTPWSTNAVEITQNMGISGIKRIEEFIFFNNKNSFDQMTNELYQKLDQNIFTVNIEPEDSIEIININEYNKKEGLALSDDEIVYLENLSKKINRNLTDSEVFGFSQVNSEHCRHKIFNGTFIINNIKKEKSLFQMIKQTTKLNKNSVVSAYKDNVAFIQGPKVQQFSPTLSEKPSIYKDSTFESVISIKAETHNFPTTVEPFSGAATGSGGEIRDRLAGGQGSIPLAGTAVYMTPYPRFNNSKFGFEERKWLYQKPIDILIKASNGASDFGNKFGQPLISGSLLTFEHKEGDKLLGFDKVIMLAGGIGYGKLEHSKKKKIDDGDLIIVLGGDNYRIGMGGAAVSSTDTGEYATGIELNAVQRSNPEMQKRVANVIRSIVESDNNFIKSIHDHGAGGHLNCISELVEDVGGMLEVDKLPIGDKTLSSKEIIGNESQERMGLVIAEKDFNKLKQICERERAPIYKVGKVIEDGRFLVKSDLKNETSIDLELSDFFGNSPKTILKDNISDFSYSEPELDSKKVYSYLDDVLSLESVACKDWLTNKVDRCVTGRIAQQQTVGEIQLPLANCGVVALDYTGYDGIASSIGHSPVSGLIDAKIGSINSIAESLTNIVWAPLKYRINSVSLSANWMWPCGNEGEDSRLYDAVEACSNFAISLGINIPTGKDSLSMVQKYDGQKVKSPGTVIVSASAHCIDIRKVIKPVLSKHKGDIFYINLSSDDYKLGGSSFGQTLNRIGTESPTIKDSKKFKSSFNLIQDLIIDDKILSGHDISSGGLITSLLEMCFTSDNVGMNINLNEVDCKDSIRLLFSENSGVLIQSEFDLTKVFFGIGVNCFKIGNVNLKGKLNILNHEDEFTFDIDTYRDIWYSTSKDFDKKQTLKNRSIERFNNYKKQPLKFSFPKNFDGSLLSSNRNKINAAVLREKGSNSEREMAFMMSSVGFNVKDIHMTDIISGRESLEDVQLLVAVGGFSNSDVLGSAKGWAGSFIFNHIAKKALENFFDRDDTLSLGVCNGCQLFIELGLINKDHSDKPKMLHNDSGKFECIFSSVEIKDSSSIMLKGMEGSKLGVWSAHGEGKFNFPYSEDKYSIAGKFLYDSYPGNPNGSDFNTAMLVSDDGRHLVMMPHLERSIYPHNWAYYPEDRNDKFSPWIKVFDNSYQWLLNT